MHINDASLKEKLINENPDFARLANEHRKFDEELQMLTNQAYLTPEEQLQETQLKKMKLKMKDQMTIIMHNYIQNNN